MHETVVDIFANVRGANDRNQGVRNDCAARKQRADQQKSVAYFSAMA